MQRIKQRLQQGFTLVELLIVIAIIGVLVSFASFSFTTAQRQGRDARRREDIREIQNAFEQYYGENNEYPAGTDIDTAFESTRPTDPRNDTPYVYTWDNTTTEGYCVCALLEEGTGNADAPPVAPATTCNFNASGTYICAQNQQ